MPPKGTSLTRQPLAASVRIMQTPEITYQWQISFAVIISLLALLVTLVRWFVESYQKKKRERIQAYEEVYEDACYILVFPYEQRRLETKNRQYVNPDPDLQKAVREYIDSHWMKTMWGSSRLVPPHIKDMKSHFAFLNLVQEEARKFQDSIFQHQVDVDLYEKSPVYHLNNPDVASRFNRVMSYVGRHLSLFSDKIRRAWEDAKFKDHAEVQREYERALDVCDRYFKHNPRDFPDPFYDLLESIRQEYRELTRKRGSLIGPRIKWKMENFYWKLSHPIQAFKERRIRRSIDSDAGG